MLPMPLVSHSDGNDSRPPVSNKSLGPSIENRFTADSFRTRAIPENIIKQNRTVAVRQFLALY